MVAGVARTLGSWTRSNNVSAATSRWSGDTARGSARVAD
jgi:hypothetical protein